MTIKDIAREAGYAVGTVSRVLNNHPDVSEKARRRVLEVVEKYNFQQNSNAKHLKQQASKEIAMIVKGTQNMLFAAIVEQIQSLLEQKSYDCQIYYIEEQSDEVEQAVMICRERRPLGILFLGSNHEYFQKSFHRITVPCVMITNSAAELGYANLASVTTDDTLAAFAAIEYLTELGHGRIGVLGGYLDQSRAAFTRYAGCRQAFLQSRIPFQESLQYEGALFSMEDGYHAMLRLMDKYPQMTAVFAMADVMAVGAMRAVRDRGLRVPEDISIMGFDGIQLGNYLSPRLTTIRQNRGLLAERGVECLLQLLESGKAAAHEVIPFQISVGESTKKRK